jgi:hypothetical protein
MKEKLMFSKYNVIRMSFKDGKSCCVKTYSSALLVWHFTQCKTKIRPSKNFSPYHPMFTSLIVAALERTYNATPGLDIELLNPDWYKDLPADIEIVKPEQVYKMQYQNIKVSEYEHWCRCVLEWLIVFGDLAKLELCF